MRKKREMVNQRRNDEKKEKKIKIKNQKFTT